MEISRVKEYLGLLAEGVDPVTGEVFPPDSPYQQPEVIRALYTALQYLDKEKGQAPDGGPRPPNAGVAWTAAEEETLKAAFASGLPVKEIAAQMGRTKGAVRSRLQRLGLMPY